MAIQKYTEKPLKLIVEEIKERKAYRMVGKPTPWPSSTPLTSEWIEKYGSDG